MWVIKYLDVLFLLHLFSFYFFFISLVTELFMQAFCQISLDSSCFLYEVHASEKPVQEIPVYYPFIFWNVLKIFTLIFFKIILCVFFQSFTEQLSLWIKIFELKKKVAMNLYV